MGVVERFARAIDYPEAVPSGAMESSFLVDGGALTAREDGGRLVLRRTLAQDPDEETLARLAGYAAGRILREEATLAWDPDGQALILWQEVPANVSDDLLRRVFEVFAASCDWWLARLTDAPAVARVPEMMILP